MRSRNEEAREKNLIEMKDLLGAYKYIFNTPEGQKVLSDLEKKCYYNQCTMELGLDINSMVFREGRRSIYLYLKQMMEREIRS
jgi:hypothetical protein